MKTNLPGGGGEAVCIVVNVVLGTMTSLGMRGLDSSADAEIVERSLAFRALPLDREQPVQIGSNANGTDGWWRPVSFVLGALASSIGAA